MPLLIKTDGGAKTIINIVSCRVAESQQFFDPIAYNVSKLAVERLTEMVDCAHGVGKGKDDGVLAFAVHPGESSILFSSEARGYHAIEHN